jgi:hypothetical protein
MRPALDPAGHRVPRVRPTCLSTPRRPHRLRPFAPALHLHQRKSSRNLHLQYSAKSQSTPPCQSLITPRSDHHRSLGAPVLSGPTTNAHNLSQLSFALVFPSEAQTSLCLVQPQAGSPEHGRRRRGAMGVVHRPPSRPSAPASRLGARWRPEC